MRGQDLTEFASTWGAAWAQYGRTIPTEGIRGAFQFLMEYSMQDIQGAVIKYSKDPQNGQFPPTAASIVRYIDGDPEAEALLAWPKAEKLICGGAYNYAVFDDPAIHRVIQDMGGFWKLGMIPSNEMKWTQKEFIERYVTIKSSGDFTYPARLKLSSSMTDDPDYQVLYVGDQTKCLLVAGGAREEPVAIAEETVRFLTHD